MILLMSSDSYTVFDCAPFLVHDEHLLTIGFKYNMLSKYRLLGHACFELTIIVFCCYQHGFQTQLHI